MKFFIAVLLFSISVWSIAQTNVALNKPVVASAIRASTTLTPNLITDGKTNTRWASEYQDNQWIYVDLLAKTDITSIRIHWHTDYATSYRVEGSLDGSDWFVVYDQPASLGKIENLPVITTARYVKLVLHTRLRTYGFSIFELMIFGTPLEPLSSVSSSSSSSSIATTSTSSQVTAGSSKGSSSSSYASSSVKPVAIKATLKWKAPTRRENGQIIPIEEVGGYEIVGIAYDGTKEIVSVINDGKVLTQTIDTYSTTQFKIAAFDTNGLYSQFVDIKPAITKGPPKVQNLRLRIE